MSPPAYNLYIGEVGSKDRKRVQLTLNPDTSIDDIKEAMTLINKKKKELWPKFKRPNYSLKSHRNFMRTLTCLELKGEEREYYEPDIEALTKYRVTDKDILADIQDIEEDATYGQKKELTQANLKKIIQRFREKIG